jgi:hypothetical protein
MIQATGKIILSNGFHVDNPLINICTQNSQKYQPALSIAQYCIEHPYTEVIEPAVEGVAAVEEVIAAEPVWGEDGILISPAIAGTPAQEAIPAKEAVVENKIRLEIIQPNIAVYQLDVKNPNYDTFESVALAGLQADYPQVKFEIV